MFATHVKYMFIKDYQIAFQGKYKVGILAALCYNSNSCTSWPTFCTKPFLLLHLQYVHSGIILWIQVAFSKWAIMLVIFSCSYWSLLDILYEVPVQIVCIFYGVVLLILSFNSYLYTLNTSIYLIYVWQIFTSICGLVIDWDCIEHLDQFKNN